MTITMAMGYGYGYHYRLAYRDQWSMMSDESPVSKQIPPAPRLPLKAFCHLSCVLVMAE